MIVLSSMKTYSYDFRIVYLYIATFMKMIFVLVSLFIFKVVYSYYKGYNYTTTIMCNPPYICTFRQRVMHDYNNNMLVLDSIAKGTCSQDFCMVHP